MRHRLTQPAPDRLKETTKRRAAAVDNAPDTAAARAEQVQAGIAAERFVRQLRGTRPSARVEGGLPLDARRGTTRVET